MKEEKSLKALNDAWFERVWNQRDRNAIFELLADDCQIGGLPPSDQPPKEAFATFHDTILAAFENLTITPHVWAEHGNTIVGHGKFKGKHRATGNNVDFRFAYQVTWKNGRVTEADNIIECQTALDQTGTLSDSSIEELLKPPA